METQPCLKDWLLKLDPQMTGLSNGKQPGGQPAGLQGICECFQNVLDELVEDASNALSEEEVLY